MIYGASSSEGAILFPTAIWKYHLPTWEV